MFADPTVPGPETVDDYIAQAMAGRRDGTGIPFTTEVTVGGLPLTMGGHMTYGFAATLAIAVVLLRL